MTRNELANTIASFQTAAVSFDLVSKDTKMRKTGNPHPNAMKHVTVSGLIGISYPNSVNNQLGREEKPMEFEGKDHAWMKYSKLNNLGTNKDGTKLYVPMKVQSSSKPVYIDNGVDVTEKVKPFISKSKAPKTQEDLDKKVIWRTPAIDSIVKARINGMEIDVV